MVDSLSKLEGIKPSFFMKANQITAIGVSIIGIGVVAGGITWGTKEYDKTKKENARSECMGFGSAYKEYMDKAMSGGSSVFIDLAQKRLNDCLAEKGYRLSY